MTSRLFRFILGAPTTTNQTSLRKVSRRKFRARGDTLRDAGKFAEAAGAYATYLERNNDDFAIWVQNGNCLKDAGQLNQAQAAYDHALALRSNDADLYLQIGHLRKLMGNLPDALQAYRMSLELSPSRDATVEVQDIERHLSSALAELSMELEVVRHDQSIQQANANEDLSSLLVSPSITNSPQLVDKKPIAIMTPLPADRAHTTSSDHLQQRVQEVCALISKRATQILSKGC